MKVGVLRRLKNIDRVTTFGDSVGNGCLRVSGQAVYFPSKDTSFQRAASFSSSVIVERFNWEDAVIKKGYRKSVNRRIVGAKILESELLTDLPRADIDASVEPRLGVDWRNMPHWIVVDPVFRETGLKDIRFPLFHHRESTKLPFKSIVKAIMIGIPITVTMMT